MVNGSNRVLHRCLWEDVNGPVPDGMYVDHKDRDVHNNHMDNLRLITPSHNCINATKTTGKFMKGVSQIPNGKYTARLVVAGKRKLIGWFDCPTAAGIAYLQAKVKHYPGICT